MVYTGMNEVHKIIGINNKYRTVDTTSDMIPIDTIVPSIYNYCMPTVVPDKWKAYKYVSQARYNAIFKEALPIAKQLLDTVSNIVIAGGAAVRPLYVDSNVYSDIDIFIYGLSDIEFWEKVTQISKTIIQLSMHKDDNEVTITQKIKRGIVIVGVYNANLQTFLEYQIILREYKTISSIIHAFDIPSCCVAYDGKIAYTTSLGAYAHANQVNIVYTNYRSNSYEYRLVKYFDRGYGIGLMEFDPIIAMTDTWKLTYMIIRYRSRINNNTIYGYVAVDVDEVRHLSYTDYCEISNIKRRNYADFINLIQNIEYKGIILSSCSTDKNGIDYVAFHTYNVKDIIGKYELGMNEILNKCINKILRSDIRLLQYMHLPKNIIMEIISCLVMSNDRIKVKNILTEHINTYSDYTPDWVIRYEPDETYTASINPIMEHPSDWYGQSYKK